MPAHPPQRFKAEQIRSARDAEWSRAIGVPDGKVLSPAEAAKWLKQDRIQQARNVADAARFKGRVYNY